MIASLLLSLPLAAPTPFTAGADHLHLHPAEASFYAELPDAAALGPALREAPLSRMLADEDVHAALAELGVPTEALDLGAAVRQALRAKLGDEGAPLVLELRALSVSGTLPAGPDAPGELGVQLVADYPSAELAARADEAVRAGLAKEDGLPGELHVALGDMELDGWSAADGARLFVGLGAVTLDGVLTRAAGGGRGLDRDPRVAPLAAGLERGGGGAWDGAPGVLVARGFSFRAPSSALGPELGAAGAAQLAMLRGPLDPLPGPTSWRMRFVHGRYVSETFSDTAGAPAPLVGVQPVDTSWLGLVPAGVMLAYCGSLDSRGLAELAVRALGEEALASDDATLGALASFEKLGPRFVLSVQPISGPALPTTLLWAELKEPEGFQEELTAAIEALGASHGVSVSSRDYRVKDPSTGERVPIPITAVKLPDGLVQGLPLNVAPSFTVVDGKLLASLSNVAVKRELKRLYEERAEASEEGADEGAEASLELGVPVPEDARSVVFMDWGALIDSLVGLVRALGPMLAGMAGPGAELPDLSKIPAPETFTRFFEPTIHWSRRLEGGLYRRHESSFGPETWGGMLALLASARIAPDPGQQPTPQVMEVEYHSNTPGAGDEGGGS